MASALQGAMASAQLTTDAMAGVASMVTSTLNRATQERQLQSNIMEGMVRSAQNAKQMEIDEFFKGKDLELRSRQLEISNQYKGIDIGLENAKLLVDQRRVSVAEDQVRLAEEKIVEADKYKPWIKNLGQERALLGKSLEEDTRKLKDDEGRLLAEINGREASGANPAILGMGPVERIKDELNPNGKHAQLKLLQTEKARALEEKQRKLKDIDEELRHVTSGGEPGLYVPIPKPKTTSSINTSGENPDYQYETDPRDGYRYPSLLPKLPDSASDTAKAGLRMLDEEIAMLEGQTPSYEEMQPISKEEEQKEFTKKYDSKLLGAIYDKNTRIQDIPALIAELSPESKVKLEEDKIIRQSDFLYDYAESKSYLFNKKYESDSKASEQFSDDYIRSGGSPEEIILMERDARNKLSELFGEAIKPIATDEYRDENQRDLYIAQKYNEWVDSRITKQKEVIKADVGDGIKTGAVGQITPSGVILDSKNPKMNEFDQLKGQFAVDPTLNIEKKEKDKQLKFESEFKGFYTDKGEFNKKSFFNAARGTKLGSIITGFDASNTPISDDPYVSETPERELYNKISEMTDKEAKEYWMKYKNYIPKKISLPSFSGAFSNFGG
jgi:hypothetical protein